MSFSYSKKSIAWGIVATFILFAYTGLCYGFILNGSTAVRVVWALAVGAAIAFEPWITSLKLKRILPYCIFALALVVWGSLCITENLEYDEGYTIAMVNQSLSGLFEITSKDVHTPLYYLVAKAFYHLFGNHIQGVKICSVVFMIAYLLLGLFPIRKEFGYKISVYFLFFSLTFPCMTIHAGNARMYSMGLFFMTLTALLAYKFYRNFTIKNWIFLTISAIVCVYVHTFSMLATFVLYMILMAALIAKKNAKHLIFFFLSGLGVVLGYLPWLCVLYGQLNNRVDTGVTPDLTMYGFMDFLGEWFSSLENPQPLAILFGAVYVFLMCFFIYSKKPQHYKAFTYGALIFVFISAIGIYMTSKIVPCYLGRYSFPVFGLLILFFALGMSQIKSKRVILVILLTYLMIGTMHYRDVNKLEYDPGLKEFQTFMNENTTPLDGVLYSRIHTQYLSVYYPELNNYIYGRKEDLNPFPNSVAFKENYQLEEVLGNLWYITYAENDAPAISPELFQCEQVFSFHYMYYDFIVYKISLLSTSE